MRNTLIELLENVSKFSSNVEKRGITVIMRKGSCMEIRYEELEIKAKKTASKLLSLGLKKNDKVIFQLSDITDFLYMFWGCIYAGVVPVPLTVSLKQDTSSETFRKLSNVSEILDFPIVFVQKNNKEFYDKMSSGKNQTILSVEDFLKGIDNWKMIEEVDVNSNDIAFIQFSSGSTGVPKGVVLKHKNLVTNISQITEHLAGNHQSLSCSWMPLTHDMGLIGFHLSPMGCMSNQTLFTPEFFIRYPLEFLRYMSDKSATFIGFPNFGIEWILKFIRPADLVGMNFNSVRHILNGAEPINCRTARKFIDLLKVYGLSGNSMCFAYGMAEACVAAALSERIPFETVVLDREAFSRENKVKYTDENEDGIELAKIGYALPGIDIIIVSDGGDKLQENLIGEICIKGENVTEGYFNYDNSDMFTHDGYLKTGDLGFLVDGKLVVAGRKKDIVFINGAKYYSHDIERLVTDIEPELKDRVVAVQADDTYKNKSILILFIKTGIYDDKLNNILKAVNLQMISRLGLAVDKFIPIKRIPKTTSGKIQRYLLQKKYEIGEFSLEESSIF